MYAVPAPFYIFVAYPFYLFCGLTGLKVLSIFSYLILILLIYGVSRIFMDEKFSAISAIAYSLFTNALVFTSSSENYLSRVEMLFIFLLQVL
jgi:hypothetical protein